MKKIELERERGFPFALAVAHFADGKSVMITGDRLSIDKYVRQINQPALVKYTLYTPNGKFPQFDLEVPRLLVKDNEYFDIKQLTGGDLRKKRRTEYDPTYRVNDIDDLTKLDRRRMFCVTRTWTSMRQDRRRYDRVCDILCTFRTLPNEFPDKLRDVLCRYTDWKG